MAEDTYLSIRRPTEAALRERSSKFLAYAFPVEDEAGIRDRLDALRKRHFDATHRCYAWRLGPKGERFRVNDDGEPAGTAGRPILGQLLARGLTECLVVVVRYFGGTKLGVPGLIAAYREAAAAALDAAEAEERIVERILGLAFRYEHMDAVMRLIKSEQPRICSQNFDNLCTMRLAVRASRAGVLAEKLRQAGVGIDENPC